MSTRTRCAIALLCVGTILAGCATSRSEIRLSSPAPAATPQATTTDRAVVIRSVHDERVFEQAPDDPSTPSLGFEGASQASDDLKARAVGRKRNSFGKAMGDILLEVSVHAQDARQMATDGAWLEILEKALAAYRTQVASKLSAPPF
jgi:hypothetical protein